ncbi:hypothetical protein CD116_02905 [Staphylococcus schweitzeri]|uniref:Nitrogen regulation protein NIFR3 n=1 Tax=Staphylococcus schweitzeri TaxID=1654388 RepID=A0A2K4AM39_9STAP|nr:hypothetical protein CD116_02905 [Staphylococcus schweitzeri]
MNDSALVTGLFNSSQPCRRGPNIEAGGKSAYNNVQVGVGQLNKFCSNLILILHLIITLVIIP